jgi:UDP-N-acetylglucosamine 4,6-dehydratase
MTSFLITGGSGTFGCAAVERLLRREDAHRIVVYSRDEQKQDAMAERFNHDERLRFFVGDVRDETRLRMALKGIEIVIHAAAMKIIPKCEYDPIEAVKTNIGGAANLISAAMESDVEQVMAVSTDKAASPANLYGATKLAAEKLFVAANNLSGSCGPAFSAVRYGNVSGSRGSVIPRWRLAAELGAPLTITHPDMTRFWITVEDAVEFVVDGLDVMQGGEVFIPKMPSFRILDLGEAIYGRPDFPREVTGVRPGEKLHEDIVTVHEGANATENDYAYVICPPWAPPAEPLPAGFFLNSNCNDDWLIAEDIKKMI